MTYTIMQSLIVIHRILPVQMAAEQEYSIVQYKFEVANLYSFEIAQKPDRYWKTGP